jgi:hypothetical protein
MVKKKRLVLIALLLFLGGGLLRVATRREEPIKVRGELPAGDFADIKRLTRHALLCQVFPDFSWATLKRLPAAARSYLQLNIQEIQVIDPASVQVIASKPLNENNREQRSFLLKHRARWVVTESATFTDRDDQPPPDLSDP